MDKGYKIILFIGGEEMPRVCIELLRVSQSTTEPIIQMLIFAAWPDSKVGDPHQAIFEFLEQAY